MGNYVLLLRGTEAAASDLERIKTARGVTVVNQTFNRAMLLEGADEDIAALARQLPDWLMAAEVTHPQPRPASPAEPSGSEASDTS